MKTLVPIESVISKSFYWDAGKKDFVELEMKII